MLAGVSVTWYTWLEQGRPINASRDVLDTLARTLRLSDAEHQHLLALAEPDRPTDDHHDTWEGGAPAALVHLVEAMAPAPAYVLSPSWHYLAWNRPLARLSPVIEQLDDHHRNLLWLVFAEESVQSMMTDWEQEARRLVAEFRAVTAARRTDPAVIGMVETLRAASPEFERWWAEHDVAGFTTRLRHFVHPRAGALVFEYQQLTPAEWPQLRVVCHLPVPGDDSAQRLAAWHHIA